MAIDSDVNIDSDVDIDSDEDIDSDANVGLYADIGLSTNTGYRQGCGAYCKVRKLKYVNPNIIPFKNIKHAF